MRSSRTLIPRVCRHSVRLRCQVVRLHDFRLLANTIENISIGGMLAGPSMPANPGEKLIVSFFLPNIRQWLDTDAEVARVIRGRRPQDRGPQLGIRFEGLSAEHEQGLRRALAYVPPAPPAPRAGRRNRQEELSRFIMESGWSRSQYGHALARWWPV